MNSGLDRARKKPDEEDEKEIKKNRKRERLRILIITLNASGRAAVHLYYVITYNIMYDVMTLARYKLS